MTDIMKYEAITPEERALGAFLSAMYDKRLDGAKMREAMLKVLGIAAPKALEPVVHQIKVILSGIDRTEFESANGWWETSTGAEFGEKKLAELLELLGQTAPKALEPLTAQAVPWNCINGEACKHGWWCSESYCQEHCVFRSPSMKGYP